MIWIDYAILAIVGISGVISLMRGFIREALSLAGWIAAFWMAIAFSGRAALWLEGYITVPSVRVGSRSRCSSSGCFCFAESRSAWPVCSLIGPACRGPTGRWVSCSACCAGL